MPGPRQQVFLSYRRKISWPLAQAVRCELVSHGYDVFMDVRNLASGEFNPVLMRKIEECEHFVLLVEPGTFDRIAEPADYLRVEIAHALDHARNIVPLLANGATMPADTDLPYQIARLPAYERVPVHHEYFEEAMQALRDRFLKPRQISENCDTPGHLSGRGGAVWWAPVNGALAYEVHRANSRDFTDGQVDVETAPGCPLPRVVGWRSWVRVRAICPGGYSPWSRAINLDDPTTWDQ